MGNARGYRYLLPNASRLRDRRAFLHFGASITLGVFTATIVSRLYFLGVRAAGPNIALFGGLMTAFNMASSALVLWASAHPGIAQSSMLINALYYLSYALGGPGFSAPLGLLIAGVSIPAGLFNLAPSGSWFWVRC